MRSSGGILVEGAIVVEGILVEGAIVVEGVVEGEICSEIGGFVVKLVDL